MINPLFRLLGPTSRLKAMGRGWSGNQQPVQSGWACSGDAASMRCCNINLFNSASGGGEFLVTCLQVGKTSTHLEGVFPVPKTDQKGSKWGV